MADNHEDLQTLLNVVEKIYNEKGLKIITKKTEWMAVGIINIEHPVPKLNDKSYTRDFGYEALFLIIF